MAVFRQIHISFWQDPFVMDLTPEEKFFYLYLMTNSKTKACGIYEITFKFMAYETGYNTETIEKLVERFIQFKKIEYDEKTREIFILNWLKYNFIRSPKTIACIKKEVCNIKSPKLKEMAVNTLKEKGEVNTELYRLPNKTEIPKTVADKVFLRDKNICQKCGSTENLTLDHIIPRILNGSNSEDNLRVLCRSCNSKRPINPIEIIKELKAENFNFDTLSKNFDTPSMSLNFGIEEKDIDKDIDKEKEEDKEDLLLFFKTFRENERLANYMRVKNLDDKQIIGFFAELRTQYPREIIFQALSSYINKKLEKYPLSENNDFFNDFRAWIAKEKPEKTDNSIQYKTPEKTKEELQQTFAVEKGHPVTTKEEAIRYCLGIPKSIRLTACKSLMERFNLDYNDLVVAAKNG